MTREEFISALRAKTQGAAAGRRKSRYAADKLHMNCKSWFDFRYPAMAALLHHSPNEGLLPHGGRDGAKRKAMGVRPGFPDFVLLVPSGRWHYLCIELKTPEGRLSPSQRLYRREVERAGGMYAVCRSLEQFTGTVNEYLKASDNV